MKGLPLLTRLQAAVLQACATQSEWPARIAAGVYAGVDFAVANPTVAEFEAPHGYEELIRSMSGCIQAGAPAAQRRPGSTDDALVAGVIGLVGDHIRLGHLDRLDELRPDLVLMILLPYLGFAEAQRWVKEIDGPSTRTD